MSILITGGAGYIGSHLVRELLSRGEALVILDKATSDNRAPLPPGATLVSGDCADRALVGALIEQHGITEIVHLAGSAAVSDSVQQPLRSYDANTIALLGLVETATARGIEHLVLCSSAAVYGQAGITPVAETIEPSPLSPYARSMLMSEMILQDLASTCGLRYVILRTVNVAGMDLGPGHRSWQAHESSLFQRAIAVALGQSGALDVFNAATPTQDGTPVRDYLHVRDLARAHAAALVYLRGGGPSRILNCGTGRGHSVLDVIGAVERHCGTPLPQRRQAPRQGDPSALIVDTAEIRSALDWSPAITDIGFIAQQVLAAAYRNAPQREGAHPLVRLVAESGVSAVTLKGMIAGFQPAARRGGAGSVAATPRALPNPSERAAAVLRPEPQTRTLTIGMATYDDYDGVYFTIQALRLYHPEILAETEFLIVDNNPGGACAPALRQLAELTPSCRYLAEGQVKGTRIRDLVFRQARGRYVLCLDCHVLVAPGALKRLLRHFEVDPDSHDLLQGPLVYDDLGGYATHFAPEWRGGMFGTWATDPAGAHPDLPAFDIPMQGLGLFACRRDAWAGFNPAFRGFGGEEGYIHEKFRQRGGRTLCLPFLRWVHRFNRPMGVPYPNNWTDRVHNYLIGFREVGWDTRPVIDHFRSLLGEQAWSAVIDAIEPDLIADFCSPAAAAVDAGALVR